ncbi:hypothetical protein RP20_CCG025985 [Aedes albopictus]|nr:hypothetical protein RP20_CCG025985 [Aedes albopictus]
MGDIVLRRRRQDSSDMGTHLKRRDRMLALGVVFLEQGKASQALAYLDKALEFDPEHEQALLNSAILLQELGRPELRKIARERLLKLLAKDESNERVHFNLGMLAMDDRNTDEAENWFRRAVHLKQDFRSALFNLALLLADDHRPLEAAPFLNQLVKYHPDHIKGLILLGDIYINNIKDLDAAENCYKRILQLDPVNIQGLHNLCVVYVERGKLAQAQACLSHAHQLAPGEDYILRHLQIVQTRIQRLRGTPEPSREKEIAFAEYDPREFGGNPDDDVVDLQQLISSSSDSSVVNSDSEVFRNRFRMSRRKWPNIKENQTHACDTSNHGIFDNLMNVFRNRLQMSRRKWPYTKENHTHACDTSNHSIFDNLMNGKQENSLRPYQNR